MIGTVSHAAYNPYAVRAYALPTGRVNFPVEPVQAAKPVSPAASGARSPWASASLPLGAAAEGIPTLREGADPAEMAIRGRIRHLTGEEFQELANIGRDSGGLAGRPAEKDAVPLQGVGREDARVPQEPEEETKSPQEVVEEAECQTCKNRKYQDGSDDPGVSFKSPTNVAPEQAASAVRGHEMEHVVREQAKAQREDRKVVQQSVTLHTAICPECGDVYISGGTTRTTTKANPQPEQSAEEEQQVRTPFEAVA